VLPLARGGHVGFSYEVTLGLFLWGWEQRRIIAGRRVLAGADGQMSLEDFLSASYALLAEEKQRIDPFKDLLSVADQVAPSDRQKVVKTTVATQNESSYAAIGAMMSGVQGRKPRVAKK
jgi:hypothetical protein